MRALIFAVLIVAAFALPMPKFPKFHHKAHKAPEFKLPDVRNSLRAMPWERAPDPNLPPINFTITNCGDPNTDYVVVKKAEVTTPMPIHEGDYITGSFEVSIVNDMKSISASVTIEKQMSETQWIKVPCLGKVGSCNYPDVCSLLSEIPADKCKAVLGQDCQCPIKARDIKMDNVKVGPVPKIPSMFSGNFRVTVNAMETSTQKRAACYVVTASVSA
jgi:hypothetical protein